MLTKDSAICIRAVDYSETSQIVTFFAKATGKFTAIAKGSKRPKSKFDGPIEVFSFGRIVFSDSNREKLATLTEFQQAPSLAGLSKNLFALNCASFAVELLNSLTDDYDPHPQLFDSLLQFLQNINDWSLLRAESRGGPRADLPAVADYAKAGRRPARRSGLCEGGATISLLILFQFTLLKEVGLMPVLNYCVNCKTRIEHRASGIEHRAYFSSAANGVVCRDCEAAFPDRIEVTASAAKCLADLKLLADAKEKTLEQIEKLLISHFTYTLGRPPKLAKHILKNT
jgi:DNA repair protein RecO (recombination protein O)